MDGEAFRLEWNTDSMAAGYEVYVGLTENVGPGGFLKRVVVPMSNSLLIEGLTAGVRYYVILETGLERTLDFPQHAARLLSNHPSGYLRHAE